MEQGQCWMWSKRKYSMSSNLTSSSPTNYPSSYDDSWEEQAFAKDTTGPGCIWPPRSYSCSFCRREFRSAQALGGHMNVHRRDRARLQQQPSSPQNEILSHHDLETNHPHNPVQNPLITSLGYLYPSSLCGLAYNNTNPNSDPAHVLASPSNNKVLAPSANKNCREETLIPLYNNSSIFHKTSPARSSISWPNLAEAGVEKISKGILDSGCRSKRDTDSDKTDVAVSLNLFVCRAYPPVQFETKEADVSFKKRKTDASSIPFFPKSSSVDTRHMQSQMFEFSPSSMEELDLELRLGYSPKREMELNTQNFNKSKQIRWRSDDLGGPGQVRSYTCTFCKRGFSNAQALGGHMNTHRRDRARLKQSSEKNLLSLDISIKNTTDHEPVPLGEKILFRFDSGEEKHDSNHKKPFTFPNKDNDHAPQRGKVIGTAELPHLPPFVGRLTAINEIRAESVVVQRIEEKKADLDLELKLGPEPQEAPTLSTRENHKRPFTFPDKDNDHAPQRGKVIGTAELPHLPSFVGRVTAINETMAGSVVVQRIEEKKADLDLELRLGPEPQEALTLSTIEFF